MNSISLRAPEPTDADFMYDIENDTDAWKYGDTVAPISRKMLRDYALSYNADPFGSGQLRLVACDSRTGDPVGLADLYDISQRHSRAFIGIYIRREYREKGYGRDTIDALCKYARKVLMISTLAAKISDDNPASLTLFSECGFSHAATLSDWLRTPEGTSMAMHILTHHL